MNIDGSMVLVALSLIVNLITIIKYTNTTENRLATLETLINKKVDPHLNNIDNMIAMLLNRVSDNVRKEDLEKFMVGRK